jgi:hypothetical protein
VALETKPAWAAELKRKLSQPYTVEEQAQVQSVVRAIRQHRAEKPWAPGTFQRLLDLTNAEDEADVG